ncbi:hypothetical protein [Phocaeicola dorei]|jgi:hypothetical protein|uniref:hypothetical protein n=1 Tax=Phocaeicola dorei TaxID=357276 RepID=UPI0021BCFFA4|nr:hypothetical protein [Phocaeicola dorei]
MKIEIRNSAGTPCYQDVVRKGSKRKFTLMKEDFILLKFSLKSPVFFKLGDWTEDTRFGRFELCDLYKPKYNRKTGAYDYELQLDAYYWKWKNKIFKYTPETAGQEASWNLTAPLDVQAGIVLRNLKVLGYTYKGQDFVFSIDSTVENKSQLMSYDNINILDACFEMAKKWDCECWVTENIIHFGRCESGDAVDFEIGKNVQEMSQSESQSTYATRIYAFGSTRNISADYRPIDETVVVNGVVQRRLMLPEGTPYIDAYPDMTTEEAVEQVVIFDEVYPRRTGIMSDVTTIEVTDKVENEDGTTTEEKWNAYRFRDTGVNFSEKYILPGQELRIRFASGLLNGLEFAVKFNPEGKPEKLEDGGWNPEAQLWEIVRNEDYGRPLPGDVLFPQDGDEYVLSGWDSTKITELGLVGAAEQELKEKTEKYAAKSKIDPSTYGCTMMSNDAYREDGVHNFYSIGQKVNLINKAYFENGRQSRVIGFEFNLDYSFDSPVYTVGETAAYSRIGELEEKVESLTLKGQTYTGGGGSGVYVIGSHDSTPATDHNVYSALRSLKTFIRKDKEDIANELITFLKGLLIGKNGSGITVLENGMSQAVIDYLYVKVKAVFDELEVKKKTYVGGEQVISHAGMKCNRVDELDDVYRCYFKEEEDGIEIENQFTPGSLAIAQECNIKTGVSHHVGNRYYWRLVTAVGENYIDLSKTVCDPNVENDVPVAGDDIVGVGHKTDMTRQAAIILSSVNEVSPSIIMYQGINNFTLTGKDVISFDFDKSTGKARMKVYGNAYIGDKDRTTYMEYTQDKGVDIKGMFHIEQGSTGWRNMEGLPDEIQAAADLAQKAQDAIDNAAVGSVNLLRNSGFTGDYESETLSSDTQLSADTELYSKQLKYWTGVATVSADSAAGSGYSAAIGSLSQSVSLIKGESYVISYKAKGTSVSVSCGSFSISQPLTSSYQRYTHKITFNGSGIFLISGTATVCDLQLERGTIATDWKPSILDNDKSMAGFQAINYIASAIKDGSVDILGGLILANMIQLGNYKDGRMQKVTAGVSGIYNDDDDVAFWAGGTLQQAILTVMKFRNDPDYQPTDTEWANMANFVATHGGDTFLRGYIYALGGKFRGVVEALGGFFRGKVETSVDGKRIVIDPETNTLEMYTADGNPVLIMKFDKSEDGWEYGDLILRKYVEDQLVFETTVYPERVRLQNLVENTDIRLSSDNVFFYGSKGEFLKVGMKPVFSGVSVSKYIADIECSNWPSKDNVSSGQVYVEYETLEGIVTNGVLKVRK